MINAPVWLITWHKSDYSNDNHCTSMIIELTVKSRRMHDNWTPDSSNDQTFKKENKKISCTLDKLYYSQKWFRNFHA